MTGVARCTLAAGYQRRIKARDLGSQHKSEMTPLQCGCSAVVVRRSLDDAGRAILNTILAPVSTFG